MITFLSTKHPQLHVVVSSDADSTEFVTFDAGRLETDDAAAIAKLDALAGMGVRRAYDHETDAPAAATDLLDVRLAPPGIPGAPRAGVGPAAAPVYDPEGEAEGRTDGGAPAGQVPPVRRGVARSSTPGSSSGPTGLVPAAAPAPSAPTIDPNLSAGSVPSSSTPTDEDELEDGDEPAGEQLEVAQPDEAADAAAQEHATKRAAAKAPRQPAKAARSHS